MKKNAAITIVSKNYMSYAITLAASYKSHYPENDFTIVLVDKADGYVPNELPGGVRVIEIAEIVVPDISRFIYRYSIMELNTAVKPYILADQFRRESYDTIIYLDPDIFIFHPLIDIYEALEDTSIVLTPHLRRPYYDENMPSDLTILQSGTYNLGFIGLKNTPTTMQMLAWWMEKLYRDCVVDIPKGLFVDQKWIDLVPALFPDHRIIYGAEYNAAYWNLHERRLAHNGKQWFIDNGPLSFFHFSGYLPFKPEVLSMHENRHQLRDMPMLKLITEFYCGLLIENKYEESSRWPYAFETLSNGVTLPLNLVREVMQWTSHELIATPCPVEEADDFCRFLMSRGVIPKAPCDVVLFHFLLKSRPEVVAACPEASGNHNDPQFRAWLRDSGKDDFDFSKLLEYEDIAGTYDYVEDAFRMLRNADRQDIFDKYRNMWIQPMVFNDFADWFTTHGIKQIRCSSSHTAALKKAIPGVGKVLNIYFFSGNIQLQFPTLSSFEEISAFADWLREARYGFNLRNEEISLFVEYAKASRLILEMMRLLYAYQSDFSKSVVSIYTVKNRQREVNSGLNLDTALGFLAENDLISPMNHFCSSYGADFELLNDFGKCSVQGLKARDNYTFVKRLREGAVAWRNVPCRVNLAGYLSVPSGMGESGRSMRSTLGSADVELSVMTLPNPLAENASIPERPEVFGWPFACADVSITVANADTVHEVGAFLPNTYWAKRNIGYWVWETSELPSRFKDSQERFHEIWTPSRYSANALSATIERPVQVLPHTLNFAAIERAKPNRRKFKLPEQGTLYGFMFDPNSVLERKNVAGLIEAFRKAFRPEDRSYLVLKVNGKASGTYEYEMIRAAADSSHILFAEAILSREDSFDFMKSLDVYVSLHRAEGFGLTCAEAMAMALPVVASNYSGNLEFMTGENSLLIPTIEIETGRPYGAYPAGTRWGSPCLEAAADAMRSLRDSERRLEIGRIGQSSVGTTLGKTRIGSICKSLLESHVGGKLSNAT